MKPNQDLIIFGVNSVREKLRDNPRDIREVVVAAGPHGHGLRVLEEEARRKGLAVRRVERPALDALAAGGKHQGVVARIAPYGYQTLEDMLASSAAAGSDCVLALDQITDPRNFGALLRTAEGVGVRRVLIPKDRSVGVTSTVVKASAGAVHHLKIAQVTNLRRALTALKAAGYWVIGLEAGAKESLYDRTYPEKLVVVLGAEGTGLRPLVREECDLLVSIPMKGKLSSLNVAVAGGVFLYEWLRQRATRI